MPFPVVTVSQEVHSLILDLQQSFSRLAGVPADHQTAVGNAYAALCQRRKDLYEYISQLERKAGVPPDVTLRFD